MKKIVCIAICVIGLACLSSCRSTSKSCGLATTLQHQDMQQLLSFDNTVKYSHYGYYHIIKAVLDARTFTDVVGT